MKCPRCGGHLVTDQSIEFYQPDGRWRCVNCGARNDVPTRPSLQLLARSRPSYDRPMKHANSESPRLDLTDRRKSITHAGARQ